MATPLESSAILSGDEIKPYRIHKLELTRLPHETVESKSRDWWEPKTQIEPLIDFW
ncbi:hypothetical protein CH063_12850 [Colletotrichum higginsianum]|uniref:Uncharacterized protein n=1 Tax=Colletotrichum higginsianum (strain IMI 349063) TaxID=759273 RepID=H1VS25_COLHI|nr:hypothetical protein CH063_12850 [Colletotrichum higginsianum]